MWQMNFANLLLPHFNWILICVVFFLCVFCVSLQVCTPFECVNKMCLLKFYYNKNGRMVCDSAHLKNVLKKCKIFDHFDTLSPLWLLLWVSLSFGQYFKVTCIEKGGKYQIQIYCVSHLTITANAFRFCRCLF